MFVLAGKTYTQHDFALHLEKYPFTNMDTSELKPLVNYAYQRFIGHAATELENSKLESKYPEFANLMKEYKEGILIYELSEEKIWRKSENDSIGLEQFYQNIKNRYLYPVRVQALRIKCVDDATAAKIQKYLAANKDINNINNKFNKKNVTVVTDTVIFSKGQNSIADDMIQNNPLYVSAPEMVFYKPLQILQPSPKPLKEIKGIVISAYQDKLEKDWIEELHRNTPIWVDKDTIYQLIK